MKEFTKAAIADTFMELLQEHTIDHITVKDLAEKCGINRQTFYYHFADIYDLMEWTLDNELKKFMERYAKTETDWKEQLKKLFVFFRFRQEQVLHAYDSQNRMYYEQFIYRQMLPSIRRLILTYQETKDISEDKRAFIEHVYTRMLVNFFLDWLDEGMPDEETVRLADYVLFMKGSLQSTLVTFQNKGNEEKE